MCKSNPLGDGRPPCVFFNVRDFAHLSEATTYIKAYRTYRKGKYKI